MFKKILLRCLFLSGLFALGLAGWHCDNAIEPSPKPGIIRVVLQSDPSDTMVVIVADTFVVGEKDIFNAIIFQGKVYADSVYAVLYPKLTSYRQEDLTYNLIKRSEGEYEKFTIFETYVPPGNYNHIQFGIKATVLKFEHFDEIKVTSPPDASLLVDLYADFSVPENGETEIDIQIKPFQSIQRHRDTYRFIPKIELVEVKNF